MDSTKKVSTKDELRILLRSKIKTKNLGRATKDARENYLEKEMAKLGISRDQLEKIAKATNAPPPKH